MTNSPSSAQDLDRTFKFFAFISYSHADEAFVKKLQDKIESYRLPSSLHKLKGGLPDKLHPLFRDATDLPPGQLSEEIRKKLAESKYLIVVCSPRSAESHWVAKEIEEFERLGRHDHIIPVIIDGEVNAVDQDGRPDQSRECFPAPLLEEVRQGLDRQLLGVSVPQDGPRRAILKVIAKMLELAPDDLIARDHIRERKRRLVWAAASFGLLLLAGLALFSYWDYQREKITYFADYVEEWGRPQGLFPLDPAEVAARSSCYRFTEQRRKLKEVAQVDSFGRPVQRPEPEYLDRPAFQTFVYEDHSGRLLEIKYLDHNRNPFMRLIFSGDQYTAIDFKRVNAENETLQAWLTAQTSSAATGRFGQADPGAIRSQVQRWKVTRDESGRIVKILYKQLESEKPAQDQDGVFGQELSLDEYGRVVKRLYLDGQGRNFTTPAGLAGIAYSYDGADLAETANFDGRDRPVLDDRRQMIVSSVFDEYGRKVEQNSLDQNRILYPGGDGVARKTWRYDQSGRAVEENYFGIDGRPWVVADGYSGWKMVYDGLSRQKIFLGTDGVPVADRRGVARLLEISDDSGNVLETAYFDLDGRPVNGPGGFSRAVNRRDSKGRLIEESFFGPDGRPIAGDQGYARVTRDFNEFGAVTEEAFWGTDGGPALNRDGAARVVTEYDERGAAETVSYFGLDGRPAMIKQGYARLRFKTDVYGRPLTVAFYGPDDRPVNSVRGYARSEATWNDMNLMADIKFYDARGNLRDPSGGRTAGLKFEYDSEGRQTATAAIDPEGLVGPMIKRSEPTETDLIAESGSVAVQPNLADFGHFAGKASIELTLFNLTDQAVTLSRALSSQPYVQADYTGGRVLKARAATKLLITCDPPDDAGGRLDGSAVFIAIGLPDQIPLVIPVLGQYNAELLPADDDQMPPPVKIPIIAYSPEKGADDPFDYSSLIVDGDSADFVNPDGSRTTRSTNDQGRQTAMQDFDAMGGAEAIYEHSYDQEGRLIQSVKIETDGARTTFLYDEQGLIIKTTETKPDGSGTVFIFKDGEVSEVTSFDAEGGQVGNPWEAENSD